LLNYEDVLQSISKHVNRNTQELFADSFQRFPEEKTAKIIIQNIENTIITFKKLDKIDVVIHLENCIKTIKFMSLGIN